MSTNSATTFSLSADELLDALTRVDDNSASLPSLDLPDFAVSEGEIAHESVFSMIDADDFSPAALLTNGADAEDAVSTDSSSELNSLLESESAVSSPTKAIKPSRKRRKHELDEVRALASTLERQLNKLKQRRQPEDPGADLFWKRVADELLLERQRAASENARLKGFFQDQVKVFKSIQKIIQKTPNLEKLGVIQPPSVPIHDKSSEIYSQLFKDVSRVHPATDLTLERADASESNRAKREVNMKMRTEDGRSVMTVEIAESKIVPFHVSTLGESVWGFLGKSALAMGNDAVFNTAFQDRGKDVFGVCRVGCSLGLHIFKADVAVRRLVDGNKLSYVWEGIGRCDNDSDPSTSFRLEEKGWVMFEPSPTNPLKESIYRICVHFTPRPIDPSEELGTAAKDVSLVTGIALSCYERTIEGALSGLLGGINLTCSA